MRTADLRRRISIQTRTTGQDTFGQQTIAWTDFLTGVPAAIEVLSGHELIAAQSVNAEVTHNITLRYHPSLADPVKVAAMRGVYVNAGVTRYFNFGAATNTDEQNRWIVIQAAEGMNQG